ncbi:MAG TPA: hypothetical protein VMF11_14680 [Candidatus Baltobacteraceae bacterium]|nr:hypothetical protein [Candidatus Baltobacteraceae bacterium]
MKKFERGFPAGTRIYAYDEYVVINGRATQHFSRLAKFSCVRAVLHVADPATGVAQSFPLSAKIVLWKNAREVAVQPGKAMPATLARDLRLHLAHLETVVNKT